MTAAAKPKAPTTHEASELQATHVSCGACDNIERWDGTLAASAWTCFWCGDDDELGPQPVWEHQSRTPLGFRDDKACHWPGLSLGDLVIPETWVYKAKVPAGD